MGKARTWVYRMLLLLTPLVLGAPRIAGAWGHEGHAIVALVAYHYANQTTRDAIDSILAGEPLAEAATWADTIKKERPATAGWHFVDIPLGSGPYSETPNCNCLVSAIPANVKALQAHGANGTARKEALKFVIHLIGDLHQPLHCATAQAIDPHTGKPKTKNGKPVFDRGGNDLDVTFFGTDTIPIKNDDGTLKHMELHWVWDSSIIEHKDGKSDDLSSAEIATYAQALESSISEADAAAWRQGDLIAWVNETHALAETNAYKDPAGTALPFGAALGDPYYSTNVSIVDRQLSRAGVRLAATLDAIFAPGPGSTVTTTTLPTGGGGEPGVALFANQNGKAYHVAGCQYVGPHTRKITLAQAHARKLHPCGVCKPPR